MIDASRSIKACAAYYERMLTLWSPILKKEKKL